MNDLVTEDDDREEVDDNEDDDDDVTSDSASIDAALIKSKFESLSSALAATNQNLVTFEYLLDHLRKHNKLDSRDDTATDSGREDIVNLLKDICGSVNDLRSEMDVKSVDLKTQQNLMEQTQLKDKCNKLEFEVECLKSKLMTAEEKYLEEKRKNVSLEEVVQEQKNDNRKLGLYLKEADEFSKEAERECHYLKKEISEVKQQLQDESSAKEAIIKDLDHIKKMYADYEEQISNNSVDQEKLKQVISDYERKLKEERETKKSLTIDLNKAKDELSELKSHSNKESLLTKDDLPPLDLDGLPSTSRSYVSSKSTDEKSVEELRESHKRLKQKTRQLLRHYRSKRHVIEKRDRQLSLQKAGLLKLQTLHQSVESNHYIVIHHLGQQLVQIAKLVSTLWPDSRNIVEDLFSERENKLSEWILYIDNLSSWIVQKLVSVTVRKTRDRRKEEQSSIALDDLENNKVSLDISEAARNEESVKFQEIQKQLMDGLQDEQTEVDTSLGTWM